MHSLIEANKTGRDFVTGLSQNEQQVVDKIYEDRVAEAEKKGEVSKKEKSEIYDKVLDEFKLSSRAVFFLYFLEIILLQIFFWRIIRMNMNINRMAKDVGRIYKRNKKLMMTVLGGAVAGMLAIMISKL